MRIGINLLYLLPGIVGGTETYAAGLLQGLATVAPDDEFLIFVNREAAHWPLPSTPNFTRVVCPARGTNRAMRYYFEQVRLPLLVRQRQVDLLHSLGYVGPVICPCPTVLTIHDLNYVDLAKTIPLRRRFPLHLVSALAAKSTNTVITSSDFSKKRLCEYLKLPDGKVTTIHGAPYPETASTTPKSWQELTQQYNIQEPYVVTFGGCAVHKNIPALLHAFELVSKTTPHSLVLIGHIPPDLDISAFRERQEMQNRIITTGYVPDDHIYPLLRHAELFIMPSLYEGFGLPVLEAQQAGVAVACSTAGSLPEVAGMGAAFFDPNSVDAIAETIVDCLSDPKLRAELRQRGQENLRRFSWEKAASETWNVYREALKAK